MRHSTPYAPDYAGILANENSTGVTIPLVNSFTLIDVANTNTPARNSRGDQANDRIIIGSSGDHRVSFVMHASIAGVNKVYEAYAYEVTAAGKTITGATKADPVVITSVGHGFSDGDEVFITGSDMTEINKRLFKVADKAADTFELTDDGGASPGNDIDGSAFVGAGTNGLIQLATRTDVHMHRLYAVNGDVGSNSDPGIPVFLNAGNYLQSFIKCDTDTTEITPEHFNLVSQRLG